MFLGRQRPSRSQLRRVLRPIDEVASPNNQIVPARKETIRLSELLRIRQILKLLEASTRGQETRADNIHHVVVALRGRQVFRHPAPLGLGRNMAVIEVPIVVRNNLEKVGNPPKFRNGISEFLSAEAVESFPFTLARADNARLLGRGFQVPTRTKGAVMPV